MVVPSFGRYNDKGKAMEGMGIMGERSDFDISDEGGLVEPQ